MSTLALLTFPNGWLNFELSVLRRLKFSSVALPFTGEPDLGLQLKRWQIRVVTNDSMNWAHTKATALIENDSEKLTSEDIDLVADDAYVPRDRLDNPALSKWFNETDAWWFDNARFNAERFESPYKRASALTVGMMVGDYVLSFGEESRHLREPLSLSRVFRRFAENLPQPVAADLRSKATRQDVRTFVAERRHTDLMFLRLPSPGQSLLQNGPFAWREEWMLGGDDFWEELERTRSGRLGSRVQSKKQYLGFVEDVLHTAAHIPGWAIAHTENGFISSEELTDIVSGIRKIDAVFTKDFSDLLGVRVSIISAAG